MSKKNRKTLAFVPSCQALDVRLAPSGNFLAHGFREVADAIKHIDHKPAEHSTMNASGETHAGGLKVHYHHAR